MEVSVVTPTYNRRRFIPALIKCYESQTYPKDKMEWIILDDGTEPVDDLFYEASKRIPNIRFYHEEDKMTIGAKRNKLNSYTTGKIIVAMDDDDYYPPTRVSSVIDAFKKYPRANVAGSSEMILYYLDTKKLYKIGPYHSNHATNNTMAWRKQYCLTHSYDEYVTYAEESSFLNDYKETMIQLDPKSTIISICHHDNTIDKSELRSNHEMQRLDPTQQQIANRLMRPLQETLKTYIKDPTQREFYESI